MFIEKGKYFLPSISSKHLEIAYLGEQHPKAKLRLHCAFLRKQGKSQPDISEITGLPCSTISDILRRIKIRGLDGAYAIKQIGQPQKLKKSHLKKLKQIVSQPPEKHDVPLVAWTTKAVHHIVRQLFGVTYTLRQIINILRGFGFTMQKPRPEHIKANRKIRDEFKKKHPGDLGFFLELDMRSSFWMKQPSVSSHIPRKAGI